MAQRIAVTARTGTLSPKHAKNYDAEVPASLEYPAVPLHAILDQAAELYPASTATIFFNAKKSYRSLLADAKRFSAGLRALGVKQGDKVAIDLPNCPQFLVAFYGALRIGAVVVPCNPLYTPPELRHQLADSGAETIVVLSRLYPVVKAAREGTKLRNVIVTNIKEEMPPLLRTLFTIAKEKKDGHRVPFAHDPGAIAFQKVLSLGGDDSAATVRSDDVAVLQYTGGTTGTSKGAMLSHRALVANALQCKAWFGKAMRDGKDAVMGVMPLFHVYGLTTVMNFAVLSGGAIILEPAADLEHWMKDIQRHKPKLFHGSPRIYNGINNSPLAKKYDLHSIVACISGSAPLLMETARKFRELTGANLVEGYGLTEASPVTHCNPIESGRRNGTIGLPFPSTDARVVDPKTGKPAATGQVGELEVAGPQVMAGYWHRPAETADVLHEGWLRTGDIATQDAEGFFTIVDRAKDLIIVGGINVYPREVEEVLMSHPAVADAAVIGMAHEHYGEVPCAFVVLAEGATATEEELFAYCHKNLARFKVPFAIRFRSRLPKTLIGKVLRKDLRAEASESP